MTRGLLLSCQTLVWTAKKNHLFWSGRNLMERGFAGNANVTSGEQMLIILLNEGSLIVL